MVDMHKAIASAPGMGQITQAILLANNIATLTKQVQKESQRRRFPIGQLKLPYGVDGKLPVNPSGGLKAKGHPIGATGVSMHVLAAMQLMNEAGDMQIPDARLAGVFNMGGASVANFVSIMERAR